jgi:hypothetical protein
MISLWEEKRGADGFIPRLAKPGSPLAVVYRWYIRSRHPRGGAAEAA